jgi:hypothetical protein
VGCVKLGAHQVNVKKTLWGLKRAMAWTAHGGKHRRHREELTKVYRSRNERKSQAVCVSMGYGESHHVDMQNGEVLEWNQRDHRLRHARGVRYQDAVTPCARFRTSVTADGRSLILIEAIRLMRTYAMIHVIPVAYDSRAL